MKTYKLITISKITKSTYESSYNTYSQVSELLPIKMLKNVFNMKRNKTTVIIDIEDNIYYIVIAEWKDHKKTDKIIQDLLKEIYGGK